MGRLIHRVIESISVIQGMTSWWLNRMVVKFETQQIIHIT